MSYVNLYSLLRWIEIDPLHFPWDSIRVVQNTTGNRL
jgi:hypothetical protein